MQVAIRQIAQMTHRLSLFEKTELVKMIMSDIQHIAENTFSLKKPLDSAYGICADYKPEPSEEDIAQMRRDVFKEFTREYV